MKPKMEIVVPIWPGKSAEQYWGSSDYADSYYHETTTATWISLRAIDHNDKYSYLSDTTRAVQDVGIYLWMDSSGTVSIDLRLHDIHSMDEGECELRLKTLKSLRRKVAKAYPVGDIKRKCDVYIELIQFFAALGVNHSMTYGYADETNTYAPLAIAIRTIANVMDERLERVKKAA